MTSGAIFGLLALSHGLRLIEEGAGPAKQPSWVLVTIAAAALCVWAGRLLWKRS